LVREAILRGYQVPAVMLTGRGSYEVDLEAMKAGVTDYLVKGEVSAQLLDRTLRYAIEQQQAKNDLRRINDELEERVRQRTQELEDTNRELQAEARERERISAELAEVQRRLIDSAEEERLHFAQELHDGPMQDLYGAMYQLEILKNQLENPEHKASVASVQEILQQVNQTLRFTAGELRPPALAPYGLEKAFRSHVEHFSSLYPDLNVRVELSPDGQRLSERVRLALFRIYQQGMANIIRHANATQVDIRFYFKDEHVVMEIEDNGTGFDVPNQWIQLARAGHLGLVGARERAEAVNGRLEVHSKPGQGTRLVAMVPTSDCENEAG
ncbi:MAG TPA: ATP-binding protein, partial [Anaerolineaceae bacterium]|nr:ATP-binding protein [Anaerolineaceae bacterium]